MNLIENSAKQDWKVFKALCPKEMMDIIKSPDLTPEQYRKLINAIKALGFYDIAMVFMIRRYEDVLSRWKGTHPEDIFCISSSTMRETKYGYEYVDLFINNVKNVKLHKYFEEQSKKYVKLK